jgi:hypothetical protein
MHSVRIRFFLPVDYLPGVWTANFPISICSLRHTDWLAQSCTSIRLGVLAQEDGYYLPHVSGFKSYDFTTYSTSRHEAHIHYERIKVMINIKHIKVGLFVFSTMVSGLALANCPGSMPERLWAMLT